MIDFDYDKAEIEYEAGPLLRHSLWRKSVGIYTNGSPEGILGICDPRACLAGRRARG